MLGNDDRSYTEFPKKYPSLGISLNIFKVGASNVTFAKVWGGDDFGDPKTIESIGCKESNATLL